MMSDVRREVDHAGVHGLYLSHEPQALAPGARVCAARARVRPQIIQPHTRRERTFSCADGHHQTLPIAREVGLKSLVGAWLGADAAINEIATVIALAKAGRPQFG